MTKNVLTWLLVSALLTALTVLLHSGPDASVWEWVIVALFWFGMGAPTLTDEDKK